MYRRSVVQRLGGLGAVAAISGLLLACQPGKPQFNAIDITGADYAKDFSLTDFNGQRRTLADFRGKAVVVFFGFVMCPDVCPTTLGEMVQVKQLLGADGHRLEVLFVTIDPERDTPELLKEYMGRFDPGFLGLRADSPEHLAALAKDFKVHYKKVPTGSTYTMDHTAASFIYDPQGRLRLYSRSGSTPQAIASDVKLLLQDASA